MVNNRPVMATLTMLGIATWNAYFQINQATSEGIHQLRLRYKNDEFHSSYHHNGPININQTIEVVVNHTNKLIEMDDEDHDDDDDDDDRIWPNRNLLRRIAIKNTIIMISANCGYVEMVQNWILHVRQLNITNYIVIAQDDSIYPVLETFAPGHVVMLNRNISIKVDEKAFKFNSEGFYTVCKQRPHMIQSILDQGYRVLYSDTDLVWLKNPFDKLPENVDYVGLVDDDVSPPEQEIDVMCSAMLYLKPNDNVANMMSYWTNLMVSDKHGKGHDQNHWRTTLQKLKGNYSMHILNKYEFPPGFMFFDVRKGFPPVANLTKENVYTVHANWIMGYDRKVKNLKKKDLWLVNHHNALICNSRHGKTNNTQISN